jgi:hypothetical protein
LLSHATCTAAARDAAAAKAAAEDAAAKGKIVVAAHETHVVKLRNDIDQLRTALRTMRGSVCWAGGLGFLGGVMMGGSLAGHRHHGHRDDGGDGSGFVDFAADN